MLEQLVKQASELSAYLECDGATRVLTYLLTDKDIPHTCMEGLLCYAGISISHYWVELTYEQEVYIIDLKSRLWFPEVQHGLIKKETCTNDYRDAKPIHLYVSKFTFEILTECGAYESRDFRFLRRI